MTTADDSRRNFLAVVLLTAVAALFRSISTYNGGIWADEGLVLNIVALPTWNEMFSFLSTKESHPPLFYGLVRVWQAMFGSSDVRTLSLVVVLGTAIVPATYFATRSLFSTRAAMIASLLVAISPSLVEHSAQLRPYGLLPVLVLISSWALAKALDGAGVRHWLIYVVATTSMLYTHHWTWLVWGGQIVAFAFIVSRWTPAQRVVGIRGFSMAVLVILALYSAWLPSFLFQIAHAGHPAPVLTDAASYALFVAIAIAGLPSMLFLGNQQLSVSVVAFLVIAIVAAVTAEIVRRFKSNGEPPELNERSDTTRSTTFAVFAITPAIAISASLILSVRSYMLLDRCLAMLTPLLLILAADWLSRTSERGRTGLFAFVVVISLGGAIEISMQRRSNTREIAAAMQSQVASGDLVIVSPQWRAPAFNHYFPPIVEQIDFPQQGRSRLIDYTGLREQRSDSAALRSTLKRITDAKAKNRRVWLVTARRYLTISPTSDISHALAVTYGNADTTLFEKGAPARYEQLLPFLFTSSK